MESTFIIIGHRAKTTADFEFNDLPGSGGGIDTLARCLATTFCLSNDIRRGSRAFLILKGGNDAPKTIKVCGDELKGMNADERSVAGFIRAALRKPAIKGTWTPSTPGTYVTRANFEDILRELSEEGASFIRLREGGEDIRVFKFPPNPCFILGDNTDLNESEERTLDAHPFSIVSVGPKSYHADHCISVVQNEFDRRC